MVVVSRAHCPRHVHEVRAGWNLSGRRLGCLPWRSLYVAYNRRVNIAPYRRTTVMLLAGEWTCMAASVRTASVQVSKAERLCAALAPAPTPAPHGAARDERHSRWSNGGHHCRLCGLLFCGRCSGGRVPLLGWGELAPTPTGLGARAIHSFRDLFIVS